MSLKKTTGLVARLAGIALSTYVAGTLAWAGIERDAANGTASYEQKITTKQSYRNQPGILTCRTTMTLLAEMSPQRTTIVNIPAPEDRRPGFDLAALDAMVDGQDCKLDLSQQDMWTATHQLAPPPRNYADIPTRQTNRTLLRAPMRRTSDLTRNSEGSTRRGLEKS
jgi:hypothetical protein